MRKETDKQYEANRGSDENTPPAEENQRDVSEKVGHMPRHWQAPGSRGETPGQAAPGPDLREVGRGNQYGEAGRAASEQIRESTTEHGQTPPPQRRDNEQLPKRPGERRSDDLPTPTEAGGKPQGAK